VVRVARLSVTPVKSTGLWHPAEIFVDTFGVAENRRFYLVDAAGRLVHGGRHGPLVGIRSSYDPEGDRLALELPGEEIVDGPIAVSGPPVRTRFWSHWVTGREVEGPWADAVSHHVGQPLRLLRSERPGQGNDSHPVSIVSSASILELQRQAGRSGVDARRFRMLIEVAGSDAHEEDRWVGGRVRLGEAVVEVVRPNPRCVVITRDPGTGEPDFDALSAIKAYRGLREGRKIDFGVYADVVRAGRVRVGDSVAVVEDGPGDRPARLSGLQPG
jgi:uncharacterized protein YcbX